MLPARVSVHHICAWYPQRPGKDIRSPGTGRTDSCEPACGYWELNQGLLEEQ